MFDQMKQMRELKKQAERIKRDLESTDVEIADVPGIRIVVNGAQEFRDIAIDDQMLDGSKKENLEKDLLKAMNAAVKRSQELAARKMRGAMPGLPGF